MKAITTLFLILLTAGVGSSVYAHPSAVPLVELKVSLTDDALTYAARIPTFAIEPLHGYSLSEGESLESLPTSSDERARSLAESVGLGDKLHRFSTRQSSRRGLVQAVHDEVHNVGECGNTLN
jgi:hypothetical protein